MKTNVQLRIVIAFAAMLLGPQLWAQTPKSVCQITQDPKDRDHVISAGTVASISGDDFYLSDGGCSIKCDLNDGVPMPTMGDKVVVYGNVEVDDDDKKSTNEDEIEIDVYSWTKEGGETPKPPESTVSTAAEATAAANGTVAELTGKITSWTDEPDGEGVFTDASGSINIDFDDNDKPGLNTDVIAVGVVTTDDGAKEVEVHYWYADGGTAPEIPTDVAFTIAAANTAPIGAIAYVDGTLSSWITTDDEGVLTEGSDNIEVDFDGDGARPSINDELTVLGIVDDDLGTREIEVKAWGLMGATSIEKVANVSVKVYPNPANNYLIVSSEADFSSIRLIATDGRVVLEQSAYNNQTIALDGITSGNYILILSNTKSIVGIEKVLVK